MVKINQVVLGISVAAILFAGCASKVDQTSKANLKKNVIESFKEEYKQVKKDRIKNTMPALVLPSVYEEPELISSDTLITFAASNAPLSKLLYVVTKQGGLSLIIDNDVSIDKNVTANMVNVPLMDAIELSMDISNTYFEIRGNILHVKKMMTKTFEVPFINMQPKAKSSLGGDILGSGDLDTGLSGEFTVDYESDEDYGDYYLQLEESFKNVLSEDAKFAINKYTGTLMVTDYYKNVKLVEKVVQNLKQFLSKQVLIDAKIMEVVLNNEHQLGINWENAWGVNHGSLSFSQTLAGATNTAGAAALNPLTGAVATTMSYSKGKFSSVIQAMESAGTIEVVSNPRLKILNGQSGLITSGNRVPYWDKEVAPDTLDAAGVVTSKGAVTYERTDVLNGISLGVTPIIKKNGDVLLTVIPIVTTIEGETTFLDTAGAIVAKAPIINVKEVGTTILTKDNDMIVIGGLISSVKKDSNFKVPGLGDMPVIGGLFNRTAKEIEKRELVIVLKIDVDENR